jgi:hypothetical protein
LGFRRGLGLERVRRGLWLEEGFEKDKKQKKDRILSNSVFSTKRQKSEISIENRHTMWHHFIVDFFRSKGSKKVWHLGNFFFKRWYIGNIGSKRWYLGQKAMNL